MAIMTKVGLEFIARNRANQQMSAFTRSIHRMGRQILIAAGVGGFGYMVRQQMKSIDLIAKMSDELKLSTQAITGWEHAAKISGTSIESLHTGLSIFVRRLGEAQYGAGEAQRGLKMLGLTANELINLGTEKAFLEIAERISLAETAAEQAGIAYQFFGRQGVQLINMFQQGSIGIEEMRKEAELLGLTFTRFDAGQVEAANDALTRARAVITGLFRQATIQLAPYIEVLADKFVALATSGEGVGVNIINVFEYMSLAAIRFGNMIQGVSAKFIAFKAGALEGAASYLEVLSKIDKFTPGIGKVNAAVKSALAASLRAEAEMLMETAGRKATGTYGQESAVRQFFSGLRKEAEQGRVEIENRTSSILGTAPIGAKEIMDIAAAQRAMFGDMKRLTIDNYQFRLKTLKDLKEKYVLAGIERIQVEQWYVEQVKKLDIELLRSTDSMMSGIKAASMQMQLELKTFGDIAYESAMTFQKGFGDAFADVVMRIKSVDDAFRALTMNVARSALSMVGQNIAGMMLAPFGIVPMQHGGIVSKPTLGLIAERGPEAVLPLNKGNFGAMPHITFEYKGLPMEQQGEPFYDGEKWIIRLESKMADRIGRGAGALAPLVNRNYTR